MYALETVILFIGVHFKQVHKIVSEGQFNFFVCVNGNFLFLLSLIF